MILLSPTVRDAVMYGGLALPVIGGLWIWRRRRAARWEIPESDALPQARVGSGRDARKRVWRAFPIALMVLGASASYWAYGYSINVVRVTDASFARGTAERGLAREVGHRIAPGAKSTLSNAFFDGEWLINDSSHAVRVEEIDYGYSLERPPTVFPPDTAGIYYHLDYVGPGQHPPSSVMTSRIVGGETRYWLTWDAR